MEKRQSDTKLMPTKYSGVTGHNNFGCMTATEWNFLPKCSQNNALFDDTVQLGQKKICDSA